MWVVTGLNDGSGRFVEQEDGATAVFNAGFRKQEQFPRFISQWGEYAQSQALRARDVSSVLFKLREAAIQTNEDLTVDVNSDGLTRIDLYARFPSVHVTAEGRAISAVRTADRLRLTVPKGRTRVTILPVTRITTPGR
jgi:hypothetical protein